MVRPLSRQISPKPRPAQGRRYRLPEPKRRIFSDQRAMLIHVKAGARRSVAPRTHRPSPQTGLAKETSRERMTWFMQGLPFWALWHWSRRWPRIGAATSLIPSMRPSSWSLRAVFFFGNCAMWTNPGCCRTRVPIWTARSAQGSSPPPSGALRVFSWACSSQPSWPGPVSISTGPKAMPISVVCARCTPRR